MTVSAGNGARLAATPLAGGGTPVKDWLGADRLPELDLRECPRLVVVAPHPDDETLGLGATMAQLAARGVEVTVVCVTDGAAAYPSLSAKERTLLEVARSEELHAATSTLGLAPPISLGLPDGEVADHEHRLAALLTAILGEKGPGTWCAATWRGDGHPDHEAVGRAASTAADATAGVLVEYPVWMWHWATPGDSAVPWERGFSVPLTPQAVERKQQAAQCFRSQFSSYADVPPLLPAFVLPRLLAVGEVLFR
jgi:LmbE family N-acetylglucosaminyl deacetylase